MNKGLIGCLGVGAIILFVVLVGGCAVAGSYNRLVGLQQKVDQSWAQVQNVYQRRADLIPNLVNTVQGAANFEKSTITEVTEARASVGQVKLDPNQAPNDGAQGERVEGAQGQLGSGLSRLLVVAERYPELKATQNFRDLQADLAGTENRIAVERMRFNEAVQGYNTTVKQAPTVFLARVFGFQPKPYFQSATGAEA